jgi:hypothetical protein
MNDDRGLVRLVNLRIRLFLILPIIISSLISCTSKSSLQNENHKQQSNTQQRFQLDPNFFKEPLSFQPLIKPGDSARSFKARTIDEEELYLDSYKGQFIYLIFWATWSNAFLEKEYRVKDLLRYRKHPRVTLVGVNLDKDLEKVKEHLTDSTIKAIPNIFDGNEWYSEVSRLYGVTRVPYFVFINPEFKVVSVGSDLSEITRDLEKQLNRSKRKGISSEAP